MMAPLLLPLCVGCTERSTATKDTRNDLPRSGGFSWVSTAVIYDTVSAKKPVSMMIIRRPGCIWCDTLENNTLRDSTVMGMIDTWFNACLIDGYSDSLIVVGDSLITCRAASREVFHVEGYPTTIFFNYNGTKSVSHLGYHRPDQYADLLYQAYNSLKAK
jgi:thioredoxin-related protein